MSEPLFILYREPELIFQLSTASWHKIYPTAVGSVHLYENKCLAASPTSVVFCGLLLYLLSVGQVIEGISYGTKLHFWGNRIWAIHT